MSSDSDKSQEDQEAPASASGDIEGMIPIDDHIEEVHENGMTVSRKGVYLLPNLFTTAALFSGFYAIISGMNGKFEAAAIAIFVAMVMDGLDGRVARLTNTQSKFGEQYDSLSDMVSFGVAPALVMFEWALVDLGKWGWAAAFCYTACAALRLARFNAQIGQVDKGVFVGLNSPSAAALIAGAVWAGHDTAMPVQLAVLLAFYVYLWARDMFGEAAGIAALTLCAFSPTVIAHGRLVTFDVGLACFSTIALYHLSRYGRRGGLRSRVSKPAEGESDES